MTSGAQGAVGLLPGAGGPVSDQVYRVLRTRILAGELAAGDRLSVPALSRELGVSRSPVRDAVIRLSKEGLAHEAFNRGAVVAQIAPENLISLYEAREALEGMAARLACARFTPEVRRRMQANLAEHDDVIAENDVRRHIDVDAAFHREIRLLADSPVLAQMLEQIQDQITIAMRSTSARGGMANAVHDHRRIFEALASGDPDASETAARRHIARLTKLLRTP